MKCFNKTLLFALIGGSFFALLPACDENLPEMRKTPVKVDFQDVIKKGTQEPATAERPVMRIAVAAIISPKYIQKYFLDLFKLIADRMDSDVEFIQQETYAQTNEMLEKMELDLVLVCSGPYVKGKADFGMEIIAVPVSQGEKVYHSYVIVNKHRGVQTLGQLRGKIFAFTDPDSNSGCLVTTYYLAEYNETPESYFKETFFTYSHDNSIKAVAEGLADGASVNSLVWDFINRVDPALTSRTSIIKKSPPYGMPPIVVHPSMEEEKKEKLRTLFFTLHEDPEGAKILNSMLIDRFEPGNDADYTTIREMKKFIDSHKS
jgi:phosphonate transport system substrate-binding protein